MRCDDCLAHVCSGCSGEAWLCGCECRVNIGGSGFQGGFRDDRCGGNNCICWSD